MRTIYSFLHTRVVTELLSAERILQVVADYKPAFYMAGPYHVQAVSCLVNWVGE